MKPKSGYKLFRNLFLATEFSSLVFFILFTVSYFKEDMLGMLFFGFISLTLVLASLYFHVVAYFECVREERGEVEK